MFWISQFFSSWEFHKKALAEVFIVSVVSIFPLVLLPFIASAKAPAEVPFDLTETLWSAIAAGQLYLYSFSLFGTIIWLCVEDVSDKAFPPRKYFTVASTLSSFMCLLIYSLDPSLSKPLNRALVYTSIGIYSLYLLMYYALLVFKMLRAPDLAVSLNAGASRLIRQSREQRSPRDRGAHD